MTAPDLIISDVFECTVQQVMGSTRPTNTFFFRRTGGQSFGSAVVDAQVRLEQLYNELNDYFSTSWSIESFIWRDRDAVPGAVLTLPPSVAIAGALADPIIPRQNALVASLRTGFAGPRYRGRVYLVGFTEAANLASGVPDSTMVTDIETEFNDWLSDLLLDDIEAVVVSRGFTPERLVDGVVLPEVTWTPFATQVFSVIVDERWDTQRRRRLN